MKSASLIVACSLLMGLLLSNCGPRGGIVAEEERVPSEAHEMKQLRRAEIEERKEDRGWR